MANSHGIGVKRNDHHRKNRKENKGHRWRGGGGNRGVGDLERIASMNIKLPPLTRDELIEQAHAHSGVMKLETAVVNYIRHHLTEYESLSKPNKLLSAKIFNAIALAYPWLADECAAQLAERTKTATLDATGIRLVKRIPGVTRIQVAELNERETAEFVGFADEREILGFLGEVDIDEDPWRIHTTLDPENFLYLPPFLKSDKVREHRFGDNASDRWWEWEDLKDTQPICALDGNPL